MAYVLPQVLVHQLFSEVPTNTVEDLNCLVFGPNYRVLRYSDASVHDDIGIGSYEDGEISGATPSGGMYEFDYPFATDGGEADPSSAVLFAEDARVKYFTFAPLSGDTLFTKVSEKSDGVPSGGERKGSVLQFGISLSGDKRDKGLPKNVVPGDYVCIEYGDSVEPFESEVYSVYESEKGSGIYDTVRVVDSMPEGLIAKGEASGETNDGTDGDVVFTSRVEVTLREVIGSVQIPEKHESTVQWEAGRYKFKVRVGDLMVSGSDGKPTKLISAGLYLQYRELKTDYCDSIHSVDGAASVQAALGELTPDNPLALGVYKCCQNAGDRIVRFMATRGSSLEDYNEVLRAAEKSDDVYMLVPLTSDSEVISAVKAHVDDMSSPENKLWRIAFISPDTPEGTVFYDPASSTGSGVYVKFSKGVNPRTEETELCVATFKEGKEATKDSTMTRAMTELLPRDVLRVYDANSGDLVAEGAVDKVLSNTALRLKEGFAADSGVVEGTVYRAEVWHNYSYNEKSSAIAQLARHYMDHRLYYVFPESAMAGGYEIPGYIMAAAVAGLASSVLPQQPITNVELTGVDEVPMVMRTFSRAQLNEMAEAGVFIVMQDLPHDRVYVRHQLSTETSSGNLLKQELSIVKNLDSVSKFFAEAFKPYIGRYNITDELIAVLRNIANQALQDLESSTAVGLYGPQVIPDGTEITALWQDRLRKDHVYMNVDLNLPKPFNKLVLSLQVI